MSDKKKMKEFRIEMTASEFRKGGSKYVEAIAKVLEESKPVNPVNPIALLGKEISFIGYAVGVIASKCGDVGIAGLTMVMNAIQISLVIEGRKEEMQFAVWEENGELHTSEEGWIIREGGKS